MKSKLTPFVLSIAVTAMLSSCSKDVLEPSLGNEHPLSKNYIGTESVGGDFKSDGLPDVLDDFVVPTDVYYTFYSSSYRSQFTQKLEKDYVVNGWVKDKNGKKVDGGLLKFNGLKVHTDPDNQVDILNYLEILPESFEQHFGNSFAVSLDGNTSAGIPSFSTTVTLPKAIKLKETTAGGGGFEEISVGSLLEWGGDPSNPLGLVLLEIRWDGANINDPSKAHSPTSVIAGVKDDGGFKLTKEFFEGLPDGAVLRVILTRGRVQLLNTGGVSVKFLGSSISEEPYVFRK